MSSSNLTHHGQDTHTHTHIYIYQQYKNSQLIIYSRLYIFIFYFILFIFFDNFLNIRNLKPLLIKNVPCHYIGIG
jgi:hypothetical protein